MCINVHMIFPKKKPDAYEHTHRAFMIAIHFSMLGGNQGRLCLPQHPVPYDPLLFAERIHASILPGEPLAEYPSNLSAMIAADRLTDSAGLVLFLRENLSCFPLHGIVQ